MQTSVSSILFGDKFYTHLCLTILGINQPDAIDSITDAYIKDDLIWLSFKVNDLHLSKTFLKHKNFSSDITYEPDSEIKTFLFTMSPKVLDVVTNKKFEDLSNDEAFNLVAKVVRAG